MLFNIILYSNIYDVMRQDANNSQRDKLWQSRHIIYTE